MNEIRLIDANALKAKIKSKYDYDDAEFDRGYNIGLQASVDLIDNAPTLPNPCGNPCNFTSPKDDLIKAFELLKAYCKNRECNKDCVFYRELRIGDNIDHQYCGLCEIVASDDKEVENE